MPRNNANLQIFKTEFALIGCELELIEHCVSSAWVRLGPPDHLTYGPQVMNVVCLIFNAEEVLFSDEKPSSVVS